MIDGNKYIRDPFSKAVLNTDRAEYERFLAERQKNRLIVNLKNDVDNLRNDVSEIKQLLHQLINGK